MEILNNIDAAGDTTFKGVAGQVDSVINGNGFMVSNYTISDNTTTGLFKNGTFTINDLGATGIITNTASQTGGMVGFFGGTMNNC